MQFCKDLAFIAHARADIPALLTYAAELEAERNAAVEDLKLAAKEMQEGVGVCVVCKHYPEDMSRGLPEICDECAGTNQCFFEWRGTVVRDKTT